MKCRFIHDCSFPSQSGTSINLQHDKDILEEYVYGQCLHRLLHQLHQLRLTFPTKSIYISKYDLDAAYRRLRVLVKHAVKATTIINTLAYIQTRLPFGTTAGSSVYVQVSEAIMDLVNDILNDPNWDPDSLHSPHASKLQSPQVSEADIPYAKAKPLAVDPPILMAFCDGYIDDLITMAVDIRNNIKRAQQAPPPAVHSVFYKVNPCEPLPRFDPISLPKLSSEGRSSESKIVMGWTICTRRFRILLPADKALAWRSNIQELLKPATKVSITSMESLIGRLKYVWFIIPNARYFLNILRRLLSRCQHHGPQFLSKLEACELKNLVGSINT